MSGDGLPEAYPPERLTGEVPDRQPVSPLDRIEQAAEYVRTALGTLHRLSDPGGIVEGQARRAVAANESLVEIARLAQIVCDADTRYVFSDIDTLRAALARLNQEPA